MANYDIKRAEVPMGGFGDVRFSVRITGPECVPETYDSKLKLFELLRMAADQPELTQCGLHTPQTLRFFHDGQRWTLEAEAVETADAPQ